MRCFQLSNYRLLNVPTLSRWCVCGVSARTRSSGTWPEGTIKHYVCCPPATSLRTERFSPPPPSVAPAGGSTSGTRIQLRNWPRWRKFTLFFNFVYWTCCMVYLLLYAPDAGISGSYSDYFEDYGQNQISAVQFSPDGLHLAIVTDDRWLFFISSYIINVCQVDKWFQTDVSCLQGSEDLGAGREMDDHADEERPSVQRSLLQIPSTGRRDRYRVRLLV